MPNTYKKKMTILWWASRWYHIKFISRELTSVFVACYVILFLFYVRSILQGPEEFEKISSFLKSPWMIAIHSVAMLALIFHSVTWFNLAPKAMVVKVGDNKLPGFFIAAANYAGWIVISLVMIWLLT